MSHKSDVSTPTRVETELLLCARNSFLLKEASEAALTIEKALTYLDLPDWEDQELKIVHGHLSRLRKRLGEVRNGAWSHEAFVKYCRKEPV